ncbi:hypothetical protein FH608_011030 [Nonomuraea phyllanthi]|uniref:Uncharacterized protein n=1 Tax=Nonomuraea phyllanthi TaxID=2219224 RepID=A0A5C4WRM2_9ACTN|nr:hypothetical protein [Nonomuraea phyllanthi]KAB8195997.1 hypothetical protein FH608_011030 [Nonomuraea phyllanthi]
MTEVPATDPATGPATRTVARVTAAAGRGLTAVRPLPGRCGASIVVRGEDGGLMLLKSVDIAAADPVATRRGAALLRESALLRKLGERHVADGTTGDGLVWALQDWIDGESAWTATAPARATGARGALLEVAAGIAHALGRLHERGHLHGDVQPAHFLRDASGRWHVLDLETAVRRDDPAPLYGGGMLHFMPPETAEGMRAGSQRIPLNVRTEVYALGAVIWFLYTGVTPIWYGEGPAVTRDASVPFQDKLAAVAANRRRRFADVGVPAFGGLESLLDECLAADPRSRPRSMDEVARRLGAHRLPDAVDIAEDG